MYLSALVFGIGVIHLAVQAASFFNHGKKADTLGRYSENRRDDWYMFFNRSQLIGSEKTEPYPVKGAMDKKKQTVQQPQRVQKRAQVRM